MYTFRTFVRKRGKGSLVCWPRKNIVVYYGDFLSNINLTEMLQVHSRKKANVTLVLFSGYVLPMGVAEADGGPIISLYSRRCQ